MAKQSASGLRFEQRMSDLEALMWNIEKDPWLNPNGGGVMVYDRPLDPAILRRAFANAVAEIPRLRERVVPGLGRFSPPRWEPDPEFDLDNHVRHVALPPPGTERQLYDLASQLMQDPFDRTRPLWVFVLIDGLEGGRGAAFSKIHHTIADGYTTIRLSELYMTTERDAPPHPNVELERVVAEAAEAARPSRGLTSVGDAVGELASAAAATAGHVWRRQLGRVRRTTKEVLGWSTNPGRPLRLGSGLVGSAGQVVGQLRAQSGPAGSPLWRERSRRRTFELVRLPLDEVKAAGKALGGTVNDMFVTGAVLGAIAYHEQRDAPLETLNVTFVVSTRGDAHEDSGGNAFAPTPVQIPVGRMAVEEHFTVIRERMADRRRGTTGGGMLGAVAGVANLLPTSIVTGLARAQTATIDFATSNMRASAVPVYTAGAKLLYTGVLGPVAGTAFNLTTVSYAGSLDIGINIDPVAVDDPGELRRCIEAGYEALLAAGGQAIKAGTLLGSRA
jgi:diacylglycerol O-acyltransferase / wax synthase